MTAPRTSRRSRHLGLASLAALLSACMAAPPPELAQPTWDSFPAFDQAVCDAEAAISLLQENAGERAIDPDRIGMIGFSAGALTTREAAIGLNNQNRPAFIG